MIYVHLADGFEEVEALTIVDILRRANCDVQFVSITDDKLIRGAHDIYVQSDITYSEADYDQCEMIVLPGGLPGSTNLEAHSGLREHIKDFAKSGKRLAAICAAPMVLGTCGVLEGKRATIYPGMEEYLKGGTATGEDVTVDGNIITGKGPALAMDFALALAKELAGEAVADEVAEGLLKKG